MENNNQHKYPKYIEYTGLVMGFTIGMPISLTLSMMCGIVSATLTSFVTGVIIGSPLIACIAGIAMLPSVTISGAIAGASASAILGHKIASKMCDFFAGNEYDDGHSTELNISQSDTQKEPSLAGEDTAAETES